MSTMIKESNCGNVDLELELESHEQVRIKVNRHLKLLSVYCTAGVMQKLSHWCLYENGKKALKYFHKKKYKNWTKVMYLDIDITDENGWFEVRADALLNYLNMIFSREELRLDKENIWVLSECQYCNFTGTFSGFPVITRVSYGACEDCRDYRYGGTV